MGQGPEELSRRTALEQRLPSFTAHGSTGDVPSADIQLHKERIERKRAEMSVTIDRIQDQLNPRAIKNRVTASARQATVGRAQEMFNNTRYGLADRVRDNPLPAAMVAIGLGWLATRKPEPRMEDYGDYRRRSAYGLDYEEPGIRERAGEGARDMAGRVQGKMSEATGSAQERVEDLKSTAQERMDDVRGRTQEAVSQVQDRAAYVAGQARSRATQARGGFEQMLDENPLAVGAITLAVGAAIGLAAPPTARENELFGDTRDRMMDQAQSKASEAVDRAQRVAQRAAATVQEEVKSEVSS